MKIAIAQINTTIGDFDGNADKIVDAWRRADEAGAALVVLPELALCGYPPRDLLAKPAFLRQNQATLERLAKRGGRAVAVVGQRVSTSNRIAQLIVVSRMEVSFQLTQRDFGQLANNGGQGATSRLINKKLRII